MATSDGQIWLFKFVMHQAFVSIQVVFCSDPDAKNVGVSDMNKIGLNLSHIGKTVCHLIQYSSVLLTM